jgi:signal transduction histidine kinase
VRTRAARLTSWSLWAVIVALAAATAALTILSGGDQTDQGLMIAALGMLGFATVGALIASRFPRNPIGWLLQVAALGFVVAGAADAYGVYTLVARVGALPAPEFVIWLGNWTVVLPLAAVPLIVLLFPDGRVPTPRWRPVAWAMVAFPLIGMLGLILRPGQAGGTARAPNLTGVESLRELAGVLMTVGAVGSLLTAAVCVVGLVVRLRRSRGEERQQIRWLAYVGSAAALTLAIGFITDEGPWSDWAFNIFVFLLAFGVPISVSLAIFKYRLYDIDVVINKTVVYGALAGFITAVYVGIVVGIGDLVGAGDEPNLGLAIAATAVVAVLFQPVRARVQRFANRLVYGKRASPYELLARFSDRVGGSYASEDVLQRMARAVAEGTGARLAGVWLRVGDELRPAATWPADSSLGDPVPVGEGRGPEIEGAEGTFPVREGDQVIGALTVAKAPGDPLRPAEEKLTEDLAAQAGLVLRNVRLTAELQRRVDEISRRAQELRASRRRIVAMQDRERRRLERDIHDGAQQHLVALAVNLNLAKALMARDAGRAGETIEGLERATRETLETLRDLARGIYPPLLEAEGLGAALRAQVERSTVPVTVESGGVHRFPVEVEAAAYFCVLEALQNVAKYAEATRAVVRLDGSAGDLQFEVTDDGKGFDPLATPPGSGLRNMADRLSSLDGEVEVRSAPGQGTTVAGRIPMPARGAVA